MDGIHENTEHSVREAGDSLTEYVARPVYGPYEQRGPILSADRLRLQTGIVNYTLWNAVSTPWPTTDDPAGARTALPHYIFQSVRPSVSLECACDALLAGWAGRPVRIVRPGEVAIVAQEDLQWLVQYNQLLAAAPLSQAVMRAQGCGRSALRVSNVPLGGSAAVSQAEVKVFGGHIDPGKGHVPHQLFSMWLNTNGRITLFGRYQRPAYVLRQRQPWELHS